MLRVMVSNRGLAALSAAQFLCGIVGNCLAVNRGHAYDLLWMKGRQDRVGRDSILTGTALSPPMTMMFVQGALTAVVADGSNRRAERVLGALGAAMAAGYLGERHVRRRLTTSGWDRLESPLVIAGIALSAAMGAVGLRMR